MLYRDHMMKRQMILPVLLVALGACASRHDVPVQHVSTSHPVPTTSAPPQPVVVEADPSPDPTVTSASTAAPDIELIPPTSIVRAPDPILEPDVQADDVQPDVTQPADVPPDTTPAETPTTVTLDHGYGMCGPLPCCPPSKYDGNIDGPGPIWFTEDGKPPTYSCNGVGWVDISGGS